MRLRALGICVINFTASVLLRSDVQTSLDPAELASIQAALAKEEANEKRVRKKVDFSAPGSYWSESSSSGECSPSTSKRQQEADFARRLLAGTLVSPDHDSTRRKRRGTGRALPSIDELIAPATVWRGLTALAADGAGIPDAETQWFPGSVIKVTSSAALFHYNGWSSEEDQLIPLLQAGALLRLPGQRHAYDEPPPQRPDLAADGTRCICVMARSDMEPTIQCDRCASWYHMECVGVTKVLASGWSRTGTVYHCPICSPPFGVTAKQPAPAPASLPAGKRGHPKKNSQDKKRKPKMQHSGVSAPGTETAGEICDRDILEASSTENTSKCLRHPALRSPMPEALAPPKKRTKAVSKDKDSDDCNNTKTALEESLVGDTDGPTRPSKLQKKKRFECVYCKKSFASMSQLQFHTNEHTEMSEESTISEKLMRTGRGPDRGLNAKHANRKVVLVASPLAVRYGSGYRFRVDREEDCATIKCLMENIPVSSGQSILPARVPFTYTNVAPDPGGAEGRAYQLNEAALQQVLMHDAVLRLLETAASGGLGRMGIDYKIDSIHHLRQTHCTWFERHIDTHAVGSLDFAIICLIGTENLKDDKSEATGCGIELFPWAQVHDESLNLVQGGNLGNTIVMKIEQTGDCSVFPGRWLYHRSVHTDVVGIRGILHKVVFFGYFLQSAVVPLAPLI